MAERIGIKKFRQNIAHYADRAEAGEEIIIMRRDKESFILAPYKDEYTVQTSVPQEVTQELEEKLTISSEELQALVEQLSRQKEEARALPRNALVIED